MKPQASAVTVGPTPEVCGHLNKLLCFSDRSVPSTNIDLHYAHCSRNLERCKQCGDMVPKRHAEEHYLNTHASVSCSLCSETMEREILAVHRSENCPQRIITCEFCEFPLPAIDLLEHQEVCGNRTELCHLCSRYIRLCERNDHEASCNGLSYDSVGVSDNTVSSSRRDDDARSAEREQGGQRRPPQEVSQRRVLFSIAITGIAVLLGSLFFQRKTENSEMH